MNASEYLPSAKEIEFFESEIRPLILDDPFIFDGYIPGWAKYVATDLDGSIYAYSEKPILTAEYWTLPHPEHNTLKKLQTGTDYCPDWQDSLRPT
jgi:hypothetical protein